MRIYHESKNAKKKINPNKRKLKYVKHTSEKGQRFKKIEDTISVVYYENKYI